MATIYDIETKVNNDGQTPQGRLTASDFNTVVNAVKELDSRLVVLSEEEYGSLEENDEEKFYFVYEE